MKTNYFHGFLFDIVSTARAYVFTIDSIFSSSSPNIFKDDDNYSQILIHQFSHSNKLYRKLIDSYPDFPCLVSPISYVEFRGKNQFGENKYLWESILILRERRGNFLHHFYTWILSYVHIASKKIITYSCLSEKYGFSCSPDRQYLPKKWKSDLQSCLKSLILKYWAKSFLCKILIFRTKLSNRMECGL